MDRTAIVIFSDPASGGDEALGRLFNALFLGWELKQAGREVALILQGAGVRWAAEIARPEHPAHGLYEALAEEFVGVCAGCADVFGATDSVARTPLPLRRDVEIPGAGGVIDLSRYLADGWRLVTF